VVAAAGALVAALPPHPAIANTTTTRPADAVIVKRFMGFSC
jgi:predicted RNase H-like nuclease